MKKQEKKKTLPKSDCGISLQGFDDYLKHNKKRNSAQNAKKYFDSAIDPDTLFSLVLASIFSETKALYDMVINFMIGHSRVFLKCHKRLQKLEKKQ